MAQGSFKQNLNLYKRFFTTLVLIPIYLYSIFYNGFFPNSIIFITSLILAFEWCKITTYKLKKIYICYYLFLIFFTLFFFHLTNFYFSILIIIIFSALIIQDFFFKQFDIDIRKCLFLGFVYITTPIIIFFYIKSLDVGPTLLFWMLIIVCSTDIFSYIFGNIIKGKKIFPILSPSKTYSGTISGLVLGTICGIFFSSIFLEIQNIYINILFSFIISFFSFLGDLFISYVKRSFTIKDSGNILPGHGGLLDRYDSVSFGLIILFFLHNFI
tara:strand:- start:313 stop:1122 length:810 start_codon:yes stop_codon:yes gene_type:complete